MKEIYGDRDTVRPRTSEENIDRVRNRLDVLRATNNAHIKVY